MPAQLGLEKQQLNAFSVHLLKSCMHESATELHGWTIAIHKTASSSKTCFAERKLFNRSVLNPYSIPSTDNKIFFVQIMLESLKVPAQESSYYWLTA